MDYALKLSDLDPQLSVVASLRVGRLQLVVGLSERFNLNFLLVRDPTEGVDDELKLLDGLR